MVGLNQGDIGTYPERLRRIEAFADQYDWRERFCYRVKRLEKVWNKQKTIDLNILSWLSNSDKIEKVRQSYISKHSPERENFFKNDFIIEQRR